MGKSPYNDERDVPLHFEIIDSLDLWSLSERKNFSTIF